MLLRMSIWLQGEGDVWAVSSNGGSSFTNVMNIIFFIHCKRHTQTHIPPLHSSPYILFLSVAGEDVRAGKKVYIVGLYLILSTSSFLTMLLQLMHLYYAGPRIEAEGIK